MWNICGKNILTSYLIKMIFELLSLIDGEVVMMNKDMVIKSALLDRTNRIDGDYSYPMKLALHGGNMTYDTLKKEGDELTEIIKSQVLRALKSIGCSTIPLWSEITITLRDLGLNKVAQYYDEYEQRNGKK